MLGQTFARQNLRRGRLGGRLAGGGIVNGRGNLFVPPTGLTSWALPATDVRAKLEIRANSRGFVFLFMEGGGMIRSRKLHASSLCLRLQLAPATRANFCRETQEFGLRFGWSARKTAALAMQAQDATTLFFLKLWPWVEANKNRPDCRSGDHRHRHFCNLVRGLPARGEGNRGGAGADAGGAFRRRAGGQCLLESRRAVSRHGCGTARAVQGAAALFDAGKFTDAQAQFQKYLDAHPGGEFSGQAALGVAACLDAQGKTDLAASAYQRVINSSSDIAVVSAAKFGLARIEESQGRLNDAFALYQDVANAESRHLARFRSEQCA